MLYPYRRFKKNKITGWVWINLNIGLVHFYWTTWSSLRYLGNL